MHNKANFLQLKKPIRKIMESKMIKIDQMKYGRDSEAPENLEYEFFQTSYCKLEDVQETV